MDFKILTFSCALFIDINLNDESWILDDRVNIGPVVCNVESKTIGLT